MNILLNPRLLFVTNTLPQAILLLLYYSQFTLIQSHLKAESISTWVSLSIALVVLWVINTGYAAWRTFTNKSVPALYGVLMFATYVAYLFAYYYNERQLFPWGIPNWILSDDVIVYAATFLMPALLHCLLIMVAATTHLEDNPKVWKSFLGAIAIPVTFYGIAQIPYHIRRIFTSDWMEHISIVLFIAATAAFLFLLIRSVYVLIVTRVGTLKKYSLLWKIPVAIIFPLLGLAINNGVLFSKFVTAGNELFGDFGHPLFYILAIVNGVLICLPPVQHKTYRLLLLAGRSITYTYTLYFFLVFLPYLPLSIVAVVAVGVGFLMLAPLILMMVHTTALADDFKFLKAHFSKGVLALIVVAGFVILPAAITGTYIHHRTVLHQALDYVYNSEHDEFYSVDTGSLAGTLKVIEGEKSSGRVNFMQRKLPYLSMYFKWLVLDNLVLSDSKTRLLKKVFFNEGYTNPSASTVSGSQDVGITGITTKSTFDYNQKAWISQVDFAVTDTATEGWQHEYASTFQLPAGCFISDYYLYVDTVKERGILAEKKAALWVYNQIVNERRDPGILYYLTGNRIAFRVFPFTKKETRKTGIEFIHKDPVALNIDGNTIALGDTTAPVEKTVIQSTNEATAYIPAAYKKTLPHVTRKPYYHFVVDASAGEQKNKQRYVSRIEKELNSNRLSKEGARVSFTGATTSTFDINGSLQQNYDQQKFTGGFYLEKAIKSILYDTYRQPGNTFPVIVVVSDILDNTIIENDFADLQTAFPESDLFYYLNTEGQLQPHSFTNAPRRATGDTSILKFEPYVLAYPDATNPVAYLRDNGQPEIVLAGVTNAPYATKLREKHWQSALDLQSDWMAQTMHPSITESRWHNLVKASFTTRMLTHVTAYMVVENEMQRETLRRKQQEVLSGKKALDAGEDDVRRGSEPELIIIVLLLGAVLWYRQRRKQIPAQES